MVRPIGQEMITVEKALMLRVSKRRRHALPCAGGATRVSQGWQEPSEKVGETLSWEEMGEWVSKFKTDDKFE